LAGWAAAGLITELAQGAARARLAPHLGGRVTALSLAPPGRAAVELLLPFPEDTTELLHWPKGGIYPLVPYSGRIRDGRLRGEAGDVALRPHPDAAPHTLHGPAHRRAWQLQAVTGCTARMVHEHPGDEEWPWALRAELLVALPAPDCCRLELRLENTTPGRAPAGLGLHPYFTAPAGSSLCLSAAREWMLDATVLPEAMAQALPGVAWDGPVTGPVTRQLSDWGGHAALRLPRQGALTLQASPMLAHLVLHRPAGVDWLCLEPASHVVDGFNLNALGVAGTGALWLDPGEAITAWMTLKLA
jgi:aldose 1-epimerase